MLRPRLLATLPIKWASKKRINASRASGAGAAFLDIGPQAPQNRLRAPLAPPAAPSCPRPSPRRPRPLPWHTLCFKTFFQTRNNDNDKGRVSSLSCGVQNRREEEEKTWNGHPRDRCKGGGEGGGGGADKNRRTGRLLKKAPKAEEEEL